jgi:hypothetical protein
LKKFVDSGGFTINSLKIESTDFVIQQENIIVNPAGEKFIVFRVGKRKFMIVIVRPSVKFELEQLGRE